MKKTTHLLTMLALTGLATLGTTTAFANLSTVPTVQNGINVSIDGGYLDFSGDAPPVSESGRTLVPLRSIFEALGASVDWDNATQTVTSTGVDGTIIKMTLNSSTYTVNGVTTTLDVPAKIINGRTFVPVRAVSESLDCTVGWQGASQTVEITTNSAAATNTTPAAATPAPTETAAATPAPTETTGATTTTASANWMIESQEKQRATSQAFLDANPTNSNLPENAWMDPNGKIWYINMGLSTTPTTAPVVTAPTTTTTAPVVTAPTTTTTTATDTLSLAQKWELVELRVIELTNEYRVANGLNALTIDENLMAGADAKIDDMITNNYFGHADDNGVYLYKSYGAKSENLQLGSSYVWLVDTSLTVEEAVEKCAQNAFGAWKASDGHNKNMLNASRTKIGVGFKYDGVYTFGGPCFVGQAVQMFA